MLKLLEKHSLIPKGFPKNSLTHEQATKSISLFFFECWGSQGPQWDPIFQFLGIIVFCFFWFSFPLFFFFFFFFLWSIFLFFIFLGLVYFFNYSMNFITCIVVQWSSQPRFIRFPWSWFPTFHHLSQGGFLPYYPMVKKQKQKQKQKKPKNNNNNEKTAWSYHWIPLQTFMVKFQTVRCVELFEKRGGGKESSLRYLKTFQLQGMKREQTSCHVRQKAWGVGQGCRPWEGHSSNPSLLLINKWEGLCCA